MPERENFSVSFTPQQSEFVSECVASGRYQTRSEVVREGLRLLQHLHARQEAEIERARELIQQGADDLDREAVVGRNAFFAEWAEELAALRALQGDRSE